MAIRNIVKEGDPILNKVCRPVTTFDDRLATLLDDMHETMIAADGVGLAGPQVGMLRRLFVVWDTTDAPEEILSLIHISEPTRQAEKLPAKRKETSNAHFVHGHAGYCRRVPQSTVCRRA